MMWLRRLSLVAVTGAALAVMVAGTAFASIGPRAYTADSAGYGASGGQFRYVQDTVYIRVPAKFATFDDGVSWETHLSGINTSDGTAVSADINVGGDPQTEATYHAWADVNGMPLTLQGNTTGLSGGQYYTETISYNQRSGVVSVSAYNTHGDSAFGQAYVGRHVSFRNPRIVGGFDPGSSFTAPSAPLTLARFTGVKLTTYSGHHGSLIDWYSHNKIFATSDGTSAGHVRAAPSNLSNAGSAFTVSIEP
jgi:hypothetical protein